MVRLISYSKLLRSNVNGLTPQKHKEFKRIYGFRLY